MQLITKQNAEFIPLYVFPTSAEQTANQTQFYRLLHTLAARSVFTPYSRPQNIQVSLVICIRLRLVCARQTTEHVLHVLGRSLT